MPSLPNPAFLLWTSDFGAGHRQAALALAQALEEMDPGAEIAVMDVRPMLHPRLYPLLKAGHRLTLEQLPVVFGQAYRMADRYPLSVSGWYGPRVQLARMRVRALLAERSWRAIVSTTGYAAMVMASFRRSGALDAPVATVITDFYAHPDWIHPGTDGLITKPGGVTLAEALAVGVPMFRVHALPGPEEENARLFVSLGLAETGDEHALVRWVEKLADPAFHEAWLARAKPHRPKEAARAAAEAALRLVPSSLR